MKQMLDKEKYLEYKLHLLDKLNTVETNNDPFKNVFIRNILHPELYENLYENVIVNLYKNENEIKRINDKSHISTKYIIKLFTDDDIKYSILKKFYISLENFFNISINTDDFMYTYFPQNSTQEIHTDMPYKFLSFVFYFPDRNVELSQEEKNKNGTILYDKKLDPHYINTYEENSMCVFAPHFYTYHGYKTTINRAALVIFYTDTKNPPTKKSDFFPNSTEFMFQVYDKLKKFSLIEYKDPDKLNHEIKNCLVNSMSGKVINT